MRTEIRILKRKLEKFKTSSQFVNEQIEFSKYNKVPNWQKSILCLTSKNINLMSFQLTLNKYFYRIHNFFKINISKFPTKMK